MTRPFRHRSAGSRGFVLVLVLWAVIVLGVLATSLAFDVQVNSKLALLQREQLQAYNLAKSGIAVAMTHLSNDCLIEDAENRNQPYDAFSDVWAEPEKQRQRGDKEDEGEKLGRGTFEFEVVDEEGKININRASPQLLRALVEYYGVDQADSEQIANAIVDWRDPDDRVQGSAAEKENELYSEMAGQRVRKDTASEDLVYQSPNEPFLTIDELQDVYGITPEMYYGFDPDSREESEVKMRNRIGQGKRARARRQSRRAAERLPLCEVITTFGSGKININTASEDVITIVLYAAGNLQNMESAAAAAKSIVEFRGGPGTKKKADADDAFKSFADLAKIPGIDQAALGQLTSSGRLGVSLDFKSTFFTIVGTGRVGNTEKTISAVVSKSLEQFNPDDARLPGNAGSVPRRRRGESRRPGLAAGQKDDGVLRIPAIRVLQWSE